MMQTSIRGRGPSPPIPRFLYRGQALEPLAIPTILLCYHHRPSQYLPYRRNCLIAGGRPHRRALPLEDCSEHSRQDEILNRMPPWTATNGRTLSPIPETNGGERDNKEKACHFDKGRHHVPQNSAENHLLRNSLERTIS